MVDYGRFESVLVRHFTEMTPSYVRDTEDRLMRAFRAFDPDNKGYIDADVFKTIIASKGDAFRQEEVEVMLGACVEEGKIFYEDFSRLLAEDTFERKYVYTMADFLIFSKPLRLAAVNE